MVKFSLQRGGSTQVYPRARDELLWYLTALLAVRQVQGHVAGTRPGVTPGRGLLLSQQVDADFGGSERRRLADRLMATGLIQQVIAVDDLSATPSARHRAIEALSRSAFDLLIVDYTSLLGRGPREILWEARELASFCNRNDISVVATVYDLLDPIEAAASQLLTRHRGRVWVMGSTAAQARNLGLAQAVGPCGSLIAPYAPTAADHSQAWEDRIHDVIFPYPGGHEVRDQLISSIISRLDPSVRQYRSSRQSLHGSWKDALGRSRSTVVVNDVRAPYLRVPRVPGVHRPIPTRHAVGRNLEALAAGVVLISQPCPPLLEWLEPCKHFLPWEGPDDAAKWVKWVVDNPEEAQRLAQRGLSQLRDLEAHGIPEDWLPLVADSR